MKKVNKLLVIIFLMIMLLSIMISNNIVFAAGNNVTLNQGKSYEFINNSDQEKNINVDGQSVELVSFTDDFSSDTGLWTYQGNAYTDNDNKYLVLTENRDWQEGGVWVNNSVKLPFTASFKYKAGGGTGADGFVFMFCKDKDYMQSAGGNMGFDKMGYGIEFDSSGSNWNSWDPKGSHIALIKDNVTNHLALIDDNRAADNSWHNVIVKAHSDYVDVYLDGGKVIHYEGTIDSTFYNMGFSAGTGMANNWHIIDDFSLNASVPLIHTSQGEVTVASITPNKLDVTEKNRVLNITGNGFTKLMNKDTNLDINIKNNNSNKSISIPQNNIEFESDSLIKIKLPDEQLEPSAYDIMFYYLSNQISLSNVFEVVVDSERKARNGGEIRVGLVNIKGNIKYASEKEATIDGDISINNVIKYKGEKLELDLETNKITGDGLLYIPINNSKYNGQINIYQGYFSFDGDFPEFNELVGKELLQYGGININIEDIKFLSASNPSDNVDGIEVSGEFKIGNVGKNENSLVAGIAIDKLRITKVGFQYSGKVEVTKPINVGFLKLTSAYLQLDTIDELIEGGGVLDIGKMISSVEGSIGLYQGKLNKIYVKADAKIPMGTTPFEITSISGGIDNIVRSEVDSKNGKEKYPTEISVATDLSDKFSPKIGGNSLISAKDIGVKVSSQELNIKGGTFYIYPFKVAEASATWDGDGFEAKGNVDILKSISGEIKVQKPRSNPFNGYGYNMIKAPSEWWLIGGKEFAKVGVEYKDVNIKASVKFAKINVSIRYDFAKGDFYLNNSSEYIDRGSYSNGGRTYSYLVDTEGNYVSLLNENSDKYLGASLASEDSNDSVVTVTIGGNIRTTGVYSPSDNYNKDALKSISLNELQDISNQTVVVPINAKESSLLYLTWTSGTPEFKVLDPNGNDYKLVTEGEEQNYMLSIDKKEAFIGINRPISGNWTIVPLNDDLLEFKVECMNVENDPKIAQVVVEPKEDKYVVKWSLDELENEKVSLYISDTNSEFTGTLLKENLTANGEEVIDLPSLPSGKYYIFAKAERDNTGSAYKYADYEINHIDKDAPEAPVNLELISAVNGEISVKWQPVSDEKLKGYIVYKLNDDETIDFSNSIFVEKEQANAIITNWEVGNNYIMGVIAVSENEDGYLEDGTIAFKEHYSFSSNTISANLPVPSPPQLSLNWTTEDGKITEYTISKEEIVEKQRYITTNKLKLSGTIDQEATTIIYLNGEQLKEITDNSINETINLLEGNNIVEIKSINLAGEESYVEYSIICDTTAPTLYIISPKNGDASSENIILVEGNTEVGTDIIANGYRISADESGNFSYSIVLKDGTSTLIKVLVKDTAGNETVYEAEVLKVPLAVKGYTPTNKEEGIITDAVIKINFNRNIKVANEFNAISLVDEKGNSIVFTKEIIENTLIIKPKNKLEYLTKYKFILPYNAIKDENENSMLENFMVEFITMKKLEGDFNSDNKITIEDFNILKDNLGKTSTDADLDVEKDLNNDGIIDIYDLVILSKKIK